MENLPGLQGPNVCEYHQRISEDTGLLKSNNTDSSTDLGSFIIRNCCPGYESVNLRRCRIKMEFVNPFKDADNFTLAVTCLGVFLLIVGSLSMFIAYRYYYRYRTGRKPAGILADEDLEGHEDNFVTGFAVAPHNMDDNPYKPMVTR